MNNFFYSFFIIIIIFTILFNIIVFYQTNTNVFYENIQNNFIFSTNKDFIWPIPGFHNISSSFGNRVHPITKKVSIHDGIDISAISGTNIYAVSNGKVVFTGFNGANGYSIHITHNNLEFIYGHVSPNFIVNIGDEILQGQIIGNVGPKYVEKTPENKYSDYTGKSTNGSTTGPHLHFSIKKDGIAVNPLIFF